VELSVETTELSGIPVLAFGGDLDGTLVNEFEQAVIEAAQDAGRRVIVDLGEVTYIDSRAFGRLLKAHVILEKEGGDLAIVVGDSSVARVIHAFGADYLLAVFSAMDPAVEYLRSLPPAAESS